MKPSNPPSEAPILFYHLLKSMVPSTHAKVNASAKIIMSVFSIIIIIYNKMKRSKKIIEQDYGEEVEQPVQTKSEDR